MSDLVLDIHEVPAEYSRNITKVRSLGNEIIWVAAAPGAEPNAWRNNALYRLVPGGEPEVIHQTRPNDGHPIGNIAGSSAGYVFSDYVGSATMTGIWRVWYLTKPGADPIKLDEGDKEFNNDDPPDVAMNNSYIAWAGVRGAGEDRASFLKVVRISSPDQATTIVAPKVSEGYVDLPALYYDELWYGIGDSDWDRGLSYPRLELRDLADPAAAPFVLGQQVRAFMPAPGEQVIVFKSGGAPEDNSINFGILTIYWRDTETVEQLPVPGPTLAQGVASYPSVGDRFVAWQDDIKSRLYVYDLAERQFRRIAELDPTYSEGTFLQRSVAGDLLAFDYSDADGPRVLRWAVLPE